MKKKKSLISFHFIIIIVIIVLAFISFSSIPFGHGNNRWHLSSHMTCLFLLQLNGTAGGSKRAI